MTYTINRNSTFGSLEITFSAMPTPAVRAAMKNRRFRWHSGRRLWYGFADENAVRAELDGLIARAERIAVSNRTRTAKTEPVPAAENPDPEAAEPIPENLEDLTPDGIVVTVTRTENAFPFPPLDELPASIAFTYRIGSTVGQANLSHAFLLRADQHSLKTVLGMIDGIENPDEKREALRYLAAVAYYDAANDPTRKPRLRSVLALYENRFGKLEIPDAENKPAPKTVAAAMKRIYASSSTTDGYNNGVYNVDGCRIATNGNMMVCLRSSVPDLPENPGNGETLLDCCNHWMEGAENRPTVTLPAIKELKAWIATRDTKCTRKRAYAHPYRLAENVWVNPFYLLDMMESLPGATVYESDKKLGALTFRSGDDFGILMPVRHTA